jgi:hypothetical protein
MVYAAERAQSGWKASHEATTDDPEDLGYEPLSASKTGEADADCRRQTWARLLVNVYEAHAQRSIRWFASSADLKRGLSPLSTAISEYRSGRVLHVERRAHPHYRRFSSASLAVWATRDAESRDQ